MWHFFLPFDEYFIKFWYPHLQRFQRSSDNCGKIHVRIILGHPIHTERRHDWPSVSSFPTAVPVWPRQNLSTPRKPSSTLYSRVVAKYRFVYLQTREARVSYTGRGSSQARLKATTDNLVTWYSDLHWSTINIHLTDLIFKSRGGWDYLAAFLQNDTYISKSKTYFLTRSPLAGVLFILLCWNVNLKWWDKCLYSNFDILKRSAERPNSPTYRGYLAGGVGLFGRFIILRSETYVMDGKLPRQQWRLFCTHFIGLTPCWTQFRTFWLSSGLNKCDISVTSSDLDFFVPHAALLFYVRIYVFSLRHRTCNWWKDIFENQWTGSLLFSPGQITPQCHSEQFCW